MTNCDQLAYSVNDLCPLLGISRPVAYELVHRADFPAIRVGRRILISKAALERWLEQQSSITA